MNGHRYGFAEPYDRSDLDMTATPERVWCAIEEAGGHTLHNAFVGGVGMMPWGATRRGETVT